ncbi:YIP1 family protein [Fundidesulfovibrio agrisoli]|uniref:YIP1 family protein n=1 Tax=Fundidesulfovibrio agrisoli TaxID=2922717 RepID=UPI001FAD1D95|nr:YIP1 family protein [Fundidesulfovibrio agrisoli]
MRIVCPQCGYSRDIPEDKIPARSSIASCPKCSFRFRFRGFQAQPERQDDLAEPVYPPRPSRPAREPEPASRPPFEARSQRLYTGEDEQPPYTQAPPRPQARWLPDPEPEPAAPASRDLPPRDPAPGTYEPQDGPYRQPPSDRYGANLPGAEEDGTAAPRRAYRAQAAPAQPFEPEAVVSYPPPRPSAEPEPVAESPATETRPQIHFPEPPPAEPLAPAPVPAPEPEPEPESTEHREWNLPPTSPRPDPAPKAAREDSEAPAGQQQAQAQAGDDSVRDIWARLQAMGAKPAATQAPGATRQSQQGQSGEPRPSAQSGPETLAPWEQLEHFGVIPAFTLTAKNILANPGDFFDQLPSGTGKVRPLIFAVAVCMVTVLFGLVWNFFGMGPNLSELGRTEWFQGLGAGALGRLAWVGLAPILVTAFVFLDSALAHLLLGLLRAAAKPYEDTFRTVCYAGGPWLLAALPVPYSYLIPVVLIWHMTLQAIGLKKLHSAGYPQVLAAVLVKWSMYFMASFAILHLLLTRR